jgi:hypothetical protein
MADPALIPPTTTTTATAANNPSSFSQALTISLKRAADRVTDGHLIYGPVAALWDEYLESDAVRKLPARLRGPLQALCRNISRTTQDHFDLYLTGNALQIENSSAKQSADRSPAREPTISPETGSTRSMPTTSVTPSSYAAIAASPPRETPLRTSAKPSEARKSTAKPRATRPDHRLLVRLPANHPAREAGSFAILSSLKRLLLEDAHLIKEVLEIKSGYALCTESAKALSELEMYTSKIGIHITDCVIEKQPNWVTYRLDFVPRTVKTIGDSFLIQNTLVTNHILSEAIRDLTGQQTTRIAESMRSIDRGAFATSWFASFESANHKPIAKPLHILGTTVIANLVKTKQKTVQCTNCYGWHNTRSCSRTAKCRICGSGHAETDHTTRCKTAKPHTCPARCINCGGPHPADQPNCPLRPVNKVPVTASQRKVILQASKLARKKCTAAVGCSMWPVNDTQMAEQPITPICSPRITLPVTTPAARFFSVETDNPFYPIALNA